MSADGFGEGVQVVAPLQAGDHPLGDRQHLGLEVLCGERTIGEADLDGFARQVLAAAAEGKRFLFRSAASLLTAFAGLPPHACDRMRDNA